MKITKKIFFVGLILLFSVFLLCIFSDSNMIYCNLGKIDNAYVLSKLLPDLKEKWITMRYLEKNNSQRTAVFIGAKIDREIFLSFIKDKGFTLRINSIPTLPVAILQAHEIGLEEFPQTKIIAEDLGAFNINCVLNKSNNGKGRMEMFFSAKDNDLFIYIEFDDILSHDDSLSWGRQVE